MIRLPVVVLLCVMVVSGGGLCSAEPASGAGATGRRGAG